MKPTVKSPGGQYSAIPTLEQDDLNLGLGPADEEAKLANARLAAAKSMAYLLRMEAVGYCGVEKSSVYGAAVAIPQVARSVGWSTTLMGLAIRSYMFLALNIFMQVFLLAVINEEMHISNAFAGHVHLCDFGAAIDKCPDGPNCRGPDGTTYTFKRSYGFDSWTTRMFVRDALSQLFPDRREEVDRYADPGEYGLEDYYCRLMCSFIFMMAVVDDLKGTIGMLTLLTHLPTDEGVWIRYEVPEWESKDRAKKVHGWTELNLVKYEVAGMPMRWKVANFVCVFLPKLFIWWTLTSSGMHFLMETAGITDLVVNCMALTFVLSIDEMIFEKLMTTAARHIMSSIEDLPLFDEPMEETQGNDEILRQYFREEHGQRWRLISLVIPKRLLIVIVCLILFICKYYLQNCTREEDGSWVSKTLHYPTSNVPYNWLTFLYGYGLSYEEEPAWQVHDPAPGAPDSGTAFRHRHEA